MSRIVFTVEEENLICMYHNTGCRVPRFFFCSDEN